MAKIGVVKRIEVVEEVIARKTSAPLPEFADLWPEEGEQMNAAGRKAWERLTAQCWPPGGPQVGPPRNEFFYVDRDGVRHDLTNE